MSTIYYESDCDPGALSGKTIAVIGYGSQGHAHALNNHDSGHTVVVGARPDSRAWTAASDDGLAVATVAEATGTPAWVGAAKDRFLRPGNVVQVEIDGVGTLTNRVRAE